MRWQLLVETIAIIVSQLCGNRIIMLYILNLYNDLSQLFLN